MPRDPEVHTQPKPASETSGRYLSTRVEPSSPPVFYTGDSVDQMRLLLQRSGQHGRYRVFDREPKQRGIDAELIGQFIVDAAGSVEWKPLMHIHLS